MEPDFNLQLLSMDSYHSYLKKLLQPEVNCKDSPSTLREAHLANLKKELVACRNEGSSPKYIEKLVQKIVFLNIWITTDD